MSNPRTLAPTIGPVQNGRQAPRQDEVGTPGGPRPAADSADNQRLPRESALIAQLRRDLVKAERRAERAEAKLKAPKRKRPPEETPEYAKRMRRQLLAWFPRIIDGDTSDWAEMHDYQKRVAAMVRAGAVALNERGTSWTEIGAAVEPKITRQGARQQWGRPEASTDRIEEAS